MIKVTEKMGFWHKSAVKILLYYEECPNAACPNDELHYPVYMREPFCPECKTKLIGGKLASTLAFRTIYHQAVITR